MPVNIEDMKCGSISGLHDSVYYDLNRAIRFMFKPTKRHGASLFKQSAKMLKFILTRLVKYNPNCLPYEVMAKIWYDDGTDFNRLMGYIEGLRMESHHYRRNRYKWTPRVQASSNSEPEPMAYSEDEGPSYDYGN